MAAAVAEVAQEELLVVVPGATGPTHDHRVPRACHGRRRDDGA